MMKHSRAVGIVLAGIVISAPATAQMTMPMEMPAPAKSAKPGIPTMIADKSKAKSLPSPIEPGMRGYGTRVVDGQTLAAMKTRCAAPDSMSLTEKARCDQLRRMLRTNPGNTR